MDTSTKYIPELLAKVAEVKPTNTIESVVIFIHLLFERQDFQCTKVHGSTVHQTSPTMPPNWNSIPSYYSFAYTKNSHNYSLTVLFFLIFFFAGNSHNTLDNEHGIILYCKSIKEWKR